MAADPPDHRSSTQPLLEKIPDHETREVLREVDESLTDHRGRGDARRREQK